MTNKRKLHESVIATTVRSNKIKSKARMDALSSGRAGGDDGDGDDDGDANVDSDGGIDGVTITDMFNDAPSGKSSGGKSSSRFAAGTKKKSRKHREDASEFIIPSRPSAAAAAADEALSIRDNKHVWLEDMVRSILHCMMRLRDLRQTGA
jgi:hypothetical protein